jgi:hypothetical protein
MAISTHGWPHARSLVGSLKESPLFNFGLVWSAFLFTRLLLLYAQLVLMPTSGDCDIRIFDRYAASYALATAGSGSIYDYCDPEYPHLALVVMALPNAICNPADLAAYRGWYRIEMAIFDLIAFVTACWVVGNFFGEETRWQRTQRLLVFVAGGLLLGTLLHTRLDVVVGALILLSLALLVSRLHYTWSFAVLAAAINFKLVPVVLIPLWVAASLPPELVAGLRHKGGLWRLLATSSWRAAVAGALTVALSVPAFLASGGRSLGFLSYHRDRGLEIGSYYSSALLLLRPLGYPEQFDFGHGSINVDAAAAPLLAGLSPCITLGLVLVATAIAVRVVLKRKVAGKHGEGNPAGDLAWAASLVLAAFIVGNKVFSPQYLLWLAPLVPFIKLRSPWRQLCLAAFAGACVLSTVLVLAWQRQIVGENEWVETATRVAGPTGLGIALLVGRNAAFIAFLAVLGVGHGGQGIVWGRTLRMVKFKALERSLSFSRSFPDHSQEQSEAA